MGGSWVDASSYIGDWDSGPRRLLTDFQAEAKRSWFSLRDSIRGARSKGVLWLPANVSLHDSSLTISTSENTKEFRPHRLVWQGPSQFSVSGLDHAGHLARVVLRFKAVENAKTAAAGLLETGLVTEELLPLPAVEIAADMTPQIPLSFIFWMVLMALVAVGFFPWDFNLADFAAWGLVALAFALPLLLLPLLKRKQPAWIRREGETVLLRTLDGSWPLVDVKVEWKDSQTFSLKTGRRRVKLSFKTPEDASATIQLLRAKSRELETVQQK